MAETITHNHTTGESIQQLHDITTRHQNAINDIQANLKTQQKAIVDIRTSVNHMIRSVSEIAAKLGFQITLPQRLALSTIPPSQYTTAVSSTTTVASSTTAALDPRLNSSLVSKVSNGTSSSVATLDSEPIHNLPRLTSILIPSKTAILKTTTNTPTITPSTILGITSIESFLDNPVVKTRSEIAALIQSNMFSLRVMLLEVLCVRPALKSSLCKEQEWANVHNLFVEMYKLKHGIKVFIFDPGGTFNIEGISDLEDKAIFEGSVMIQYHCIYTPKRTLHRPARYLGT